MAKPTPGMNRARAATGAIASLIIGAALNLIVAWGLVWAKPFPAGSSPSTAKVTTAPVDALAIPSDVPRPDKLFSGIDFAETYWQMIWDEPGPDGKDAWPPRRSIVAHLTRSGWPVRSLQHVEIYDVRNNRTTTPIPPRNLATWRSGIDIGANRYPLFPVWPGFLINTLFYAAITGAFLWSITALRTRARTRAGLCPTCAYDRRGLSESTPCPECGTSPRR
jgi:hypothetical protein